MAEIQKKVAIVTGASRGIGARTATRLAKDGCAVVVNYFRDKDAASAVVSDIREAGGSAVLVGGNVADPATIRSLFDTAHEQFGGVDILINNAGSFGVCSLVEAQDEMFNELIDVNLKGTFYGMREAAQRMRDAGRIINLSSSVVGLNQPGYALYAATKAGVEAMTPIVAKELGARGITVNVIAPGPIATDLFLNGKDEDLIARITGNIPLGRLGEVSDIASAVSILASADAAWINGQVVRVNGGMI